MGWEGNSGLAQGAIAGRGRCRGSTSTPSAVEQQARLIHVPCNANAKVTQFQGMKQNYYIMAASLQTRASLLCVKEGRHNACHPSPLTQAPHSQFSAVQLAAISAFLLR